MDIDNRETVQVQEKLRRRIRVRVDHGKCIASGRCVSTVPEVFSQNEEGLASAAEVYLNQRYRDLVYAAADACPASAIIIDED